MKVRITHDTIRIRLNQSEVQQLGNGNPVQLETAVDQNSRLSSILQPADVDQIELTLKPFSIVVNVPRPQLQSWAHGDVIALDSRQANGAADGLTILIEKDFHCLHRDSADDADTFPNPNFR